MNEKLKFWVLLGLLIASLGLLDFLTNDERAAILPVASTSNQKAPKEYKQPSAPDWLFKK